MILADEKHFGFSGTALDDFLLKTIASIKKGKLIQTSPAQAFVSFYISVIVSPSLQERAIH